MTETGRQRAAFARYWELGPRRTIRNLHARLLSEEGDGAPSLSTLFQWSRRFHWQTQLQDLEQEAAAAADAARRGAQREMAERHATEGLLLQKTGTEWIQRVPEERITADAAIRALMDGTKLERLARGEPTDRSETVQAAERRLEALNDDELDELIQLVTRRLAGEGPAAS